jgi:hypothetical protein
MQLAHTHGRGDWSRWVIRRDGDASVNAALH